MPRARAEWLLAPLLLLPVAAGAALCLWARFAYQAEVEPYRLEGERRARAWLTSLGDGGLALREQFLRDHPVAESEADVPVRVGDFRGSVRVPSAAIGTTPWEFSEGYPGGLLPAALADATVRIDIESGRRAAATLDGADDATRSFGALLGPADLGVLRTAPLPPATKLFLVRRWRRDAPDDAALAEAETLLTHLRDAEHALPNGWPAAMVGEFRAPGTRLFGFGTAREARLLPMAASPDVGATYTLEAPDAESVRLVWGTDGDAPGETLWSGVLAQPLAGHWSLVLPHGDRWWDAPPTRRWAGVVLAALLAFLFLPGALLIAIRKQRRLDEARARFLNELAHDLRTPLTSLRLYAEMLAGDRVADADRTRYTDVIARESGRLSGLLANLLDLSRLEHGTRVFDLATLGLPDLVAAAARDFSALHPARVDDITVDGAADTRVRADPTALARCLANVLDNAGKFTPAGTAIRVRWESRGDTVAIVIEDDGAGIPADERGRLFARYERGSDAQANGVPGTGLGLSLVRELMEGMGGSAALLEDRTGASFELRLPGGAHA